MKLLKRVKSLFLSLHFLLFLNGFIIALFIFCRLQDDYESRLFVSVSKNIISQSGNSRQDLQILQAQNTIKNLLKRRTEVFANGSTGGFLDDFVHPISADLMTAEGACSSYAAILCRVLNTMGFETRFAQMKVDGVYGGHIVMEVKTAKNWVVLDPFYDLHFTRQDGNLASFDEVAGNWTWYKKQVPTGYNQHYSYDGVRYTNWDKVPIILPGIKKTLSIFMDKQELEHFSLRNYFLRKYLVLSNILLLIIFPLSIVIAIRIFRLKFSGKIKLHGMYKELPAAQSDLRANA